MALLFIDGFDHYDPQALDALGDPLLARGKAAYLSRYATRIPGRRPASWALRLPQGNGGGYVKNLEAGVTSMLVGAAIRVSPFDAGSGIEPVLMGIRDTSTQVLYLVKLGDDARLRLYRRDGTNGWDQLLSASVSTAAHRGWHYLEFLLTQSSGAGTVQVRLNGSIAINLTGQNTQYGAGPLLTAFLGAVPSQAALAAVDIDDFYMADTSGTINNTFLGDVRVDLLLPNEAGTLNQFSPTPSGATPWQIAADNDEATLLTATAAGQRQSFGFAALPTMSTPAICGVQVTSLARKTDAGSTTMKALAVSGASTSTSAAINLQEQAAWNTAVIERNPNGAAVWTEATLNAAEFGVESA
jgi:hypothetical protein